MIGRIHLRRQFCGEQCSRYIPVVNPYRLESMGFRCEPVLVRDQILVDAAAILTVEYAYRFGINS
jgi:hypothetical protein